LRLKKPKFVLRRHKKKIADLRSSAQYAQLWLQAVLKFNERKEEVVERGDGSYDSTSLFLYIRQLL
jgi:hypothetical protein